jgi:hypothetical protein
MDLRTSRAALGSGGVSRGVSPCLAEPASEPLGGHGILVARVRAGRGALCLATRHFFVTYAIETLDLSVEDIGWYRVAIVCAV